jgi:SAM-dependent methyltransferase
MAASAKTWILGSVSIARRQWRMRRSASAGRSQALSDEVKFWRDWFANSGLEWPDEYARRTDFTAEVEDPVLRGMLAELSQERVEILDVGAGPTTTVGYRFPGKDLAITAVDPLADEYNRVLTEAGIDPPVQAERVNGEDLVERFGPGTFDIAFSRNALDHAIDPVPIIENMLEVLRPSGCAVLRHVPNEAVTEDYHQLHQWNVDERAGHCIVWRNPRHERDLNELLAERAEVTCHRDVYDGYEWICCVLRKREPTLS